MTRSCLKGDLSGKDFGYVRVLNLSLSRTAHGHRLWQCRCICGSLCLIDTSSLASRKNVSCGCKRNFRAGISQKAALNRLHDRYRYGAKSRNLPFKLSHDELLQLSIQDCYYCGSPASQSMQLSVKNLILDLKYNGIDRIDNSLGYTPDNCRPCCKFCNLAKRDLSERQFFEQISKISNKHKLSNELR